MRVLIALVVFALIASAFARAPVHGKRNVNARRSIGSAECDICTWVVTQAESLLAQNSTEQEIINTLDKACSIFGPFSAECQSLVATYVPQVVSLLEQKVPPAQVCTQIGLCSSRMAGLKNEHVARAVRHAQRFTARRPRN